MIRDKTVGQQYRDKYNSNRRWFKLMIQAEKDGADLAEELNKRRAAKRNAAAESNAEELVEKKYRKDKTKLKMAAGNNYVG